MTTTENTTRPSNNTITRRKMLQSVAATSAIPLAAVMSGSTTASSSDVATAFIDPETAGLTGLPLAAVHIERAIAAMAEPGLAGRWRVSIHSGDPDQYWGFRQMGADEREFIRPVPTYTGYADDLSFVTRKIEGCGFDYWNVDSTGDYSEDCALGRRLGEEYLTYIGQHPTNGNATLLQCIADSMIARRREPRTSWGRHTTGIEMAFFAAVNEYAMATAKVLADHRSSGA
ncbi:hypothetical protein [Devosia elaeis]|uniref:Uncharacterized protein n=1 Tax=Devosia elaeis TaxID=1770058 RepID=A0A178HTX3_9HYPH|nr:hypothetical protein [Devosia elaeis]OAM75484.1 hypothetical protein A3840_14665 [Devosia elaeis]